MRCLILAILASMLITGANAKATVGGYCGEDWRAACIETWDNQSFYSQSEMDDFANRD